jgi:GT2 family glycosyltransferase
MVAASVGYQLSVVLSTYNRADRLTSALDALLTQSGTIDYEILVIDNNSTDTTARVVQAIASGAGGRVKYVFEPRQGLSHARNRGIAQARAPLVAFSDDDVRVSSDWVAEVVRAFNRFPDAAYIGGRVLPHWLEPPPAWLTTAHWSPLALQDYGDRPFDVSRERAICLVGANLVFRRGVFDRLGGFAPELGRIKDGIGSTEDHDLQLRVWRAGMRGTYVPQILATADVTPDRLARSYHRRWHRGHGRHAAAMRLRELVPADMGAMSEPRDLALLFGSPAFVYADLPRLTRLWLRALVRGEDSFFYANKLRHVWSYLRTRQQLHPDFNPRGIPRELTRFAGAYRRRRSARTLAAASCGSQARV